MWYEHFVVHVQFHFCRKMWHFLNNDFTLKSLIEAHSIEPMYTFQYTANTGSTKLYSLIWRTHLVYPFHSWNKGRPIYGRVVGAASCLLCCRLYNDATMTWVASGFHKGYATCSCYTWPPPHFPHFCYVVPWNINHCHMTNFSAYF